MENKALLQDYHFLCNHLLLELSGILNEFRNSDNLRGYNFDPVLLEKKIKVIKRKMDSLTSRYICIVCDDLCSLCDDLDRLSF
jgi:hypothetical protein